MDYRIFEKINKILSYLEDEESKKIFLQRVLYRISGDMEYIFKIASYSSNFKLEKLYDYWLRNKSICPIYPRLDVLNFLVQKEYKKKKIILFGAGNDGVLLYKLLTSVGINVDFVWDNQKSGVFFKNMIEKPKMNEMLKEQGLFLISTSLYAEEISMQLYNMGVNEEQIFIPNKNCIIAFYGKPYFESAFFKPKEGAVFIDGGAWIMDTAMDFMRYCPDYKKIYSFEPEPENYKRCRKIMEEKELCGKVELFPMGLWDKEDVLHFKQCGDIGSGSHVEDAGTVTIRTDSLDHILQGEKVDYIKMDIEGAELMALKGAKYTIQQYKPWMAICLYHKPDDIFDIPLYIKELVPEYKMAIRHYTTYLYDTILYCWI